jgi:hypothetical protein
VFIQGAKIKTFLKSERPMITGMLKSNNKRDIPAEMYKEEN